MMMYRVFLIPLAVLALALASVSCGPRSGNGAGSGAGAQGNGIGHRLTPPKPPVGLGSDSARLEYVLSHYWDSFDRRDTTWIADTAAMEQAFADWTGVLRYLPEPKAAETISDFFRSTEVCPAVRDRLLEVAERYFYDPNSPLRNEALYIPVLQYIIASLAIEEVYKIRPRAQLESALKNRPGMVAADFAYKTGAGVAGHLSGVRAEHTLLLFYNPGCGDCARVEQFIVTSQVLAPLIAAGTLKVLAVYVDVDFEAWRAHLPQMPAGWIVGCDPTQTITGKELYALPAIPNLYLLDKNKRVLLKDTPVEQIEAWFAQTQKQEAQR